MKNYIAQWRDYRLMSQEDLGAIIGKSGATVSRYEAGKQAVSADMLSQLALILQCGVSDLLENPPPEDPARKGRKRRSHELSGTDLVPPTLVHMNRDMPVHGTAEGGPGAFVDTGQAIDFVRRPPGLVGAQNAYALFVVGDSMAPKYEAGNLIFVHPDRPPTAGDDVIVQLLDSENEAIQAMIKRLVRRTEKFVIFRQFNPDKEIQVATGRIAALHKVMTAAELMGI